VDQITSGGDDASGGLSSGDIAGIVIACLAAVAVGAVAVTMVRKKKSGNGMNRSLLQQNVRV
jgi:hypothetical protein